MGGKYLRPRGPQCIWRASPPALPGSSGQLNLGQHSVSVKRPQSDEKGRQTSGVIELGIDQFSASARQCDAYRIMKRVC